MKVRNSFTKKSSKQSRANSASHPRRSDNKNSKTSGKFHTKFTGIYMNEYMKKVFRAVPRDPFRGKCKYCHSGSEKSIWVENLHYHFTSKRHEMKTPNDEKDLLYEAIQDLKSQIKVEVEDENKPNETSKAYLGFLSFCISENLSFSQISSLGKYLKEFIQEYGASIFKCFSFDREELSKIVSKCIGNSLLEEIKQDLEENKYSFTKDASTIHKENVCALTAKYIKKNEDGTSILCNKLIEIEDLEVQNTGKTFFGILKKSLLSSEKLSSNFIGWSHDHGSNLSSFGKGLRGHLKETFKDKYYFDLDDPCHSLNLALEHALKGLPDDFERFIHKIHAYFASPQRRLRLKELQIQNELEKLALARFVDSRWLSLGESIDRLLIMWPSLVIYFEETKENSKKQNDENVDFILSLLKGENFRLKMSFLNIIIEKINKSNTKLQSHILPVHHLKSEIINVFRQIAKIILTPGAFGMNIKQLTSLDWGNDKIMIENFRSDDNFVEYLRLR